MITFLSIITIIINIIILDNGKRFLCRIKPELQSTKHHIHYIMIKTAISTQIEH